MEVEVDTAKLQNMILRVCSLEEGTSILAYVNSSSELNLNELIYRLIINGAERRTVLSELRRFGINDFDIADAFSDAIANIVKGDMNEETG